MTRSIGLVAAVLVLAGCGSGKEGASPATSPRPTATVTTSDCTSPADAATSPRLSPALQNRETVYLTDVNAYTRRCLDRVTFTLRKGTHGPGYEVSYQPAESAKIEDGSGKHLEIAGSAFLVVRLSPAATAELKGDQLELTYTGPRRLRPEGFNHVLEIVKTGDFESVVTWVIGLDEKRPFTATDSETNFLVQIS